MCKSCKTDVIKTKMLEFIFFSYMNHDVIGESFGALNYKKKGEKKRK